MRILVVVPLLFLFVKCEFGEEKSKEELLYGKWMLISVDGEPLDTRAGYEFATNKQYFTVDSQGKPIPKLMERVWSIDGDTLKLVDFNWESELIDKKGTIHFQIKELNATNLKVIQTKGKDREGAELVYEKI